MALQLLRFVRTTTAAGTVTIEDGCRLRTQSQDTAVRLTDVTKRKLNAGRGETWVVWNGYFILEPFTMPSKRGRDANKEPTAERTMPTFAFRHLKLTYQLLVQVQLLLPDLSREGSPGRHLQQRTVHLVVPDFVVATGSEDAVAHDSSVEHQDIRRPPPEVLTPTEGRETDRRTELLQALSIAGPVDTIPPSSPAYQQTPHLSSPVERSSPTRTTRTLQQPETPRRAHRIPPSYSSLFLRSPNSPRRKPTPPENHPNPTVGRARSSHVGGEEEEAMNATVTPQITITSAETGRNVQTDSAATTMPPTHTATSPRRPPLVRLPRLDTTSVTRHEAQAER